MAAMSSSPDVFIHSSAVVETGATLGTGTKVWANVQVRTGAVVGRNCVLGRNCFVDIDVTVGDNVKVQNNASLYEGVTLENGVFVGPHVIFTNDKVPRAVNPDGSLKSPDDWMLGRTVVQEGAAIGAGSVIVTGITIGRWSIIGSGAVVTKPVPDHALVLGNPARVVGWVSAAGKRCDDQATAIALTKLERSGATTDGSVTDST
jgi:acetyltransferase-like isoleucine patch superfamily enzyme